MDRSLHHPNDQLWSFDRYLRAMAAMWMTVVSLFSCTTSRAPGSSFVRRFPFFLTGTIPE